MSKKKTSQNTDQYRLSPEDLRRRCDESRFKFESTAELPVTREIIGQPRGVRAIEFGIDMKSDGYNIYVLGPTGTGRLTTVEHFIRDRATKNPTPDNWLYVHNFEIPHQPKALSLPAGSGDKLRADMDALVTYLSEQIPQAFDSQTHRQAARLIHHRFEDQRDAIYHTLREKAAEKSMAIVQSESGLALVPIVNGELMEPADYESLPVEERDAIEQRQRELEENVESELTQVRKLEIETQARLDELTRKAVSVTVDARLDDLKQQWADHPNVTAYLDAVRADITTHSETFRPGERKSPAVQPEAPDPFWRYRVNVLVSHQDNTGAPVVVVNQPTFQQLVGRIEQRLHLGVMQTDFTMIKPGALHRANGGYLVVRAIDVFRQPYAWDALKQAISTKQIDIENPDVQDVSAYTVQSLDPEPIPLHVKVVLLGSPWLYYTLYEHEEDDFPELFKVKSDFAIEMDRTAENEDRYALFIAARCNDHDLPHFDRSGVARVVEYGSRLAESQKKLSTRFGDISDLVHEAAYWASRNGHDVVAGTDVQQAINERLYRHDLDEEQAHKHITDDGAIFLDTEGEAVGQVNSLAVTGTPDHFYGQPGRITAQVYVGREGVTQLDREVNLSGPLHGKGNLTMRACLGAKYAQERPLSLTASLSFEQNYSHVDGDSASSTELYALLSALSGAPIKQGIAVTGSVNQRGEVQPIGGANEKIEGYFDICSVRGFTGQQGVIIPKTNAQDLMLKDAVIEAVQAGQFHLWAVANIDEGIEILTGVPAGKLTEDGAYPEETINRAVLDRLRALDEKDSDRKDGEDDTDDEDEQPAPELPEGSEVILDRDDTDVAEDQPRQERKDSCRMSKGKKDKDKKGKKGKKDKKKKDKKKDKK